jgi:hypothetical protein
VNRAFFGTHQLTAADFTPVLCFVIICIPVINVIHQEQKQARVQAKKKKYEDIRQAAADGSATDHQLDLLVVVKTTGWERRAAYA